MLWLVVTCGLDGGLLVNILDRIKLSRVTFDCLRAVGLVVKWMMMLQLGTELLWSNLVEALLVMAGHITVTWHGCDGACLVENCAAVLIIQTSATEELDMLHLHYLAH